MSTDQTPEPMTDHFADAGDPPTLQPLGVQPSQPQPLAQPMTPVRQQRRNRWLDVALGAAAVIAIAGIAFAGGRLTAPAPTRTGFGGGNLPGGGALGQGGATLAPGQTPGPGFRGGFGGAIALQGTITEVTADHLTLKLASGQTIQIPISSDTAYHREAAASSTDVQTGTQVLIQLQQSANGGGIRNGQLPAARDVTIIGQ